jgi:type IV secretion system protein VirD4
MFKNFFEKMIPEDPKDIDELNPVDELMQDLKQTKNHILWYVPLSLFLSTFISGMIYQVLMNALKGNTIYLLSSFKYGITKMILLTLVLVFLFVFGAFRVYRSLKRNYLMNYKDNYMKSKRETYGGAHFQDEEELKENFEQYDSIEETTGDIFGISKDGKYQVFKMKPGLNYNEIYFGAPGCGKTSATMKTKIYQAIRRGDSVLCTDTKGDLYRDTSAVARKHGYKVRVLNLKAEEFKNSDGFNIFETLDRDDPALDAKADIIANIIMKLTESREDLSYWPLNEFNMLKCLIMYIATDETRIKLGRNNFPEILNVLGQNNPATFASLFSTYAPESPIRICYNIFAQAEERNQGQILNGLGIRFNKLINPYLQKVLSHGEINFIEPMKSKCLYYCIFDDTDNAYQFLSSIFFSCMLHDQVRYFDRLNDENRKKTKRVFYLLDEYYASGGIYEVNKALSTLRSRKIGISIILQNRPQLDSMYTEEEAASILSCCAVKGLLLSNDEITSDYWSKILGTQTVVGEANRYLESSADIIHAHAETQKTLTENQRPLMLPEEFTNGKFQVDDIIYAISTEPPVLLKKCYAEKSGERLHPLEKESVKLGAKPPHLHKPKWRKLDEDKKAAKEAELREMTSTTPKTIQKEETGTTAVSSEKKTNTSPKKAKYSVVEESTATKEQKPKDGFQPTPKTKEPDFPLPDDESFEEREETFSEMWSDSGIFE